ncbi:MAG: iron ABC transporter permease [Muribaculaceae bacterium]|nr:iron ABC transporter permease [Muribaculaceae bacterium]MDE6831933.1 iron ABC transporter permease [Muribaculaceae bacterium]
MKRSALFLLMGIAALVLFAADLCFGSTSISLNTVISALTGADCDPTQRNIILNIRLLKALTAVSVGVALSVSGLQMQTLFRNPLAGPYVLGISSGASLGVALFILGAPGVGLSLTGTSLGMAGAAWAGAAAVLLIVGLLSRRISDIMVILILGIMLSSGIAAVVQILQYLSSEDALKHFVVWTMGSLNDVTADRMAVMIAALAVGLILAVATIKPLNLLLMGEQYARTMGLNLRRSRALLFVSTTLLAGTVTAFCGPIGFVGLAMPHVARALFRSSDHRVLLPAAAMTGVVVMLGCDILSKLYALPINSITAIVGIPVVAWIVLKKP